VVRWCSDFFLNSNSGRSNPIRSTRHYDHQWPIVPDPGDYADGEIGGMMIGRANWSTRRKPAPVPLCPPQTPHAVRTRTRAAAVGSQRLTAWPTARHDALTCLVYSLTLKKKAICSSEMSIDCQLTIHGVISQKIEFFRGNILPCLIKHHTHTMKRCGRFLVKEYVGT
jgi:hypothetical protein